MPCVNYQHFTTRSSVSAQKSLSTLFCERGPLHTKSSSSHSTQTLHTPTPSFLSCTSRGQAAPQQTVHSPCPQERAGEKKIFLFSKPKTPSPTFFSYAHVVSLANLSRSLPSRPTAHLSETRLQCKGELRRADFAVGRFGYFLAHWREADRKRMRGKSLTHSSGCQQGLKSRSSGKTQQGGKKVRLDFLSPNIVLLCPTKVMWQSNVI